MPYRVSCRDCDWEAPEPIDLKGEANLVAGRHISRTDHSVNLERVEE